NVFDLKVLSYEEVVNAIRSNDPHRFLFTIETYPEYGKYHWTGHRSCHVSLPPEEARRIGNICPVCHKKLTKGVDQRVDELADRPKGFRPEGVPGYKHLLPLSEIIQTVLGVSYPGAQSIWKVYNSLIRRFGNEYTVLLEAPLSELAKVVDVSIVDAVIRVREERVKVIPGYDGIYGEIRLHDEERKNIREDLRHKLKGNRREQRSLADYM
ncbi:DNA helicase UvrD, partial [Candidatus Bathyarchaeota archaeon]